MRIRVALETSITRFGKTGVSVYAEQLSQALQQSTAVEVVACAVPDMRMEHLSTLTRKCYAAYWQVIHAHVIIPLRVKTLRCDIVHYTAPMPIPAILPCHSVATVHDIIPFVHPEWMPKLRAFRSRKAIQSSIKRASHIITDSNAARKDIIRSFDIPQSRITPVWLGVDSQLPRLSYDDAYSIINQHYHISPGYILCVGSIEPRKNLQGVVEAYKILCRKQDGNVPKLVIVGGSTWSYTRINELITNYKLQSHVIFTGHVAASHLSALFTCAGVFVYPSLYEGFGLPPLEAMLYNCPVVTSNTSSLPEVVADTAIVVDPTDYPALANAMDHLLQDTAFADKLRRQGRKHAEYFTWERCARETVAVYQRVLEA